MKQKLVLIHPSTYASIRAKVTWHLPNTRPWALTANEQNKQHRTLSLSSSSWLSSEGAISEPEVTVRYNRRAEIRGHTGKALTEDQGQGRPPADEKS